MKPTKLCGFRSMILQASHTIMISTFSFLIDISCIIPDRRYVSSKSFISLISSNLDDNRFSLVSQRFPACKDIVELFSVPHKIQKGRIPLILRGLHCTMNKKTPAPACFYVGAGVVFYVSYVLFFLRVYGDVLLLLRSFLVRIWPVFERKQSQYASRQIGIAAIMSRRECCFRKTVEKQVSVVSTVIRVTRSGVRRLFVCIAAIQTAAEPMACSEGNTLVFVSTL